MVIEARPAGAGAGAVEAGVPLQLVVLPPGMTQHRQPNEAARLAILLLPPLALRVRYLQQVERDASAECQKHRLLQTPG